jgi:hypothetical protein
VLADVGGGEAVACDCVVDPALFGGPADQSVDGQRRSSGLRLVLVVGEVATAERRAFVAEERDREAPAAVDLTDDLLGRHPGFVEEHLVELRGAGHLHERADRDPRLLHREGEHRDAAVLGDVEVGSGEQDAEVGDVCL